MYVYIYIYIERERERGSTAAVRRAPRRPAPSGPRESLHRSIVLEAPIPNMSLGDKTSLHVISISSDKQQLSMASERWPLSKSLG